MNKQTQNLTYKDLNGLIDKWTVNTLNAQEIFAKQAEAAKQHLLETGTHNDHLRQVNDWLNVLRYHDKLLEDDIGILSQNLASLEDSVKILEDKQAKFDDIMQVDPVRARIFDGVEHIFISLQQWKELNDSNCQKICQFEEQRLDDPVEQVRTILMNQLGSLEEIETQLYKMMTCIANIETRKDLIVRQSKGVSCNPT